MSGMITAAAAAVVGVGVGAYEASNAASVGKNEENATKTQLGMEQTQFGEQQQYASQLATLMANPSSVTSTPGYQFNFDQGVDATSRGMAAGGFLNSGNEASALTSFGQGMAMNTFNQQATMLANLAGFNAPAYGSNATGSANAATSANNSTFNSTGQLLASLGFMAKTGGFSFGSTPTPTAPTALDAEESGMQMPGGGTAGQLPFQDPFGGATP